MRFMLIRRADENTEAGAMPSAELVSDMMKYNEEMVRAGVMLQGEGLHPSSRGVRVRVGRGRRAVIDGPFAETKELIAGFTMIRVSSKAEAIEWVQKWPESDTNAEIEIRQVFEPEDFGEYSEEIRRQEELLRAQNAKART